MPTASRVPKRTTLLEPSITTSMAGSPRCEPGTGLFVWTIWAAMLAVGLLYVIRFGPDVPRWDDYAVIPQLTGAQPVTLAWLWSQHSEHRIPLARLILLGTFRLTEADPRPVMLLIVGLLAVLAAVLVRAARRCRGGYHHADAFLPIALLNLGQHENLLWSIQITYVLPVVLLGMVLALVVRSRGIPGLGSLAVASACVSLMPLCNAGGLAFIPALTIWFWSLAAGVRFTKAHGGRWCSPNRGSFAARLGADGALLAWLLRPEAPRRARRVVDCAADHGPVSGNEPRRARGKPVAGVGAGGCHALAGVGRCPDAGLVL